MLRVGVDNESFYNSASIHANQNDNLLLNKTAHKLDFWQFFATSNDLLQIFFFFSLFTGLRALYINWNTSDASCRF